MKKKKKQLFENLGEKYKGDGVDPKCFYFGRCGGCMFQDIAYENQLLLKKEYLNTLLEGITEIDEVAPSIPYFYRNRMDMVTAFGKTGLRQRGNFRNVVDIGSCEIMQEKSNYAFGKVRELLQGIEDYNYLSHEGYLRYTVIRQGMFTGEVMCNFVIAKDENRLQKVIEGISDEVDSISLIFHDGLADLSFGDIHETIKKGYIEEKFDSIKYQITPNSFFQSNSHIALSMYRRIREEVQGRVLDLYSGVGSISLFVADKAEKVTGIEIVEEAVKGADINKAINEIDNVEFICADARPYLRELNDTFDTLLLDPPRSGMHPKMLKYINASGPEKIVYMSCNPATFKNDIIGLENYKLRSFDAFDMFPQTPHIETLAVLDRK